MINSLFPDIDLLSAVRLNSNGNFALIFQPFHLASISVFFCFVFFLTYGIEFVLFLAVLENSVLPMGWDSPHKTLNVKTVVFKRPLTRCNKNSE